MSRYVVCLALILPDLVFVHLRNHRGPRGSHGMNGPGGRIEDGETPAQAAAREWAEEVVGLGPIPVDAWEQTGHTSGDDWEVFFMSALVRTPQRGIGPTVLIDGAPATFVPFGGTKYNWAQDMKGQVALAFKAMGASPGVVWPATTLAPAPGWKMPEAPQEGAVACAHPVSQHDGWSLYWADDDEDNEPLNCGGSVIPWPFGGFLDATRADFEALGFRYVD